MLKGPYRVISETIVADERPPSPSRGRRGVKVFGRCFSLRNSQVSWTVASRNGL
jgi:hypothetical protein